MCGSHISHVYTENSTRRKVNLSVPIEALLLDNRDKNRKSFSYDLVYIDYSFNPQSNLVVANVICPLSFGQ